MHRIFITLFINLIYNITHSALVKDCVLKHRYWFSHLCLIFLSLLILLIFLDRIYVNYSLKEKCKFAVGNFTEEQAERVELNPIISSACQHIMERHCEVRLELSDLLHHFVNDVIVF